MTPSNLVKSVKFWNYLAIIINFKNQSCPRFPLTMKKLELLYEKDTEIVDDENGIENIKLTRDGMPI